MKQLRRRLTVSVFALTASLLVTLTALVIAMFYRDYSHRYTEELTAQTQQLRDVLNAAGGTAGGEIAVLDRMQPAHRITLLAADGTVLYDSAVPAASLGNHADRAEVQQAQSGEVGVSRRYSVTQGRGTVNVAMRLDSGRLVRVSDTRYTLRPLLLHLTVPVLLFLLLALLLSLWLSLQMARAAVEPINRLDPACPDENAVYEELRPLVRRITAQNEQIREQMQDLREKHEKQDAMRRDFTANVSHELKTPLTSISGYAEIIKNGIARSEDVPRFAEKIYGESQRLMTLVGDILRLSQLDGEAPPREREEVDLYAVCERVIAQLELAARRQEVTVLLTGEHRCIWGDGRIAEEMVYNLCDNAIQYNRPGGMVTVSIRQCVDGVELSVEDTGCGIPPEDQPHIFERFYRVDKSHSRRMGGTGLGLSIVKHGALALGAQVSLQSQPGVGTTVRVLF